MLRWSFLAESKRSVGHIAWIPHCSSKAQKAKVLTAFGWAIKELLFLSFLCRHVAIDLYGVTGGLMLCECDRKQMRCALTALLRHCWTANVRSQTAYAHNDKSWKERSGLSFMGFRLNTCAYHLSVCFDRWAHVYNMNSMLEYSAGYSGLQGAKKKSLTGLLMHYFHCRCFKHVTHGSPGVLVWTEVSLSGSVTRKTQSLLTWGHSKGNGVWMKISRCTLLRHEMLSKECGQRYREREGERWRTKVTETKERRREKWMSHHAT